MGSYKGKVRTKEISWLAFSRKDKDHRPIPLFNIQFEFQYKIPDFLNRGFLMSRLI